MICPHCQTDNNSTAKFCSHCGQGFARQCLQCEHTLSNNAKYCEQCGTAATTRPSSIPDPAATVASASRQTNYTPAHLANTVLQNTHTVQGQRKLTTVLFMDIAGSQKLAEQLDPEQWHEFLDQFFSIITHWVHHYEGTVNQYTGDGIMALFGAPIAHEDHAQRACHAALAMREPLLQLANTLRLEQGFNVSTRTGLNTGEVVVGAIGDNLRTDYTAQGHAVGLAARMESMAKADSIYLTANTAAAVQDYFELKDIGPTAIKGNTEQIHVYELLALGHMTARLELSAQRGLSAFTGRSTEFEQLHSCLQSTIAGNGKIIGLRGDAGIGKSRLCYEFIQHCENVKLRSLKATGLSWANAQPMLPVKTLFQEACGITSKTPNNEAMQRVAGTVLLQKNLSRDDLELLLDFLHLTHHNNLTLNTSQRFEKLQQLFKALVMCQNNEPTVLLLEDLHWLDPDSSHFLSTALLDYRSQKLLIIFNYRPDYNAYWMQKNEYLEIDIAPLTEQTIQSLVYQRLQQQPNLKQLANDVARQANGNPYFAEETLQSLLDTGVLQRSADHKTYELTKNTAPQAVPHSIRDLLAGRIDRLPEQHKTIIQTAAILGRNFDAQLLAATLQQPISELTAELDELIKNRFLQRCTLDCAYSWEFYHPLMQEVAYAEQLHSHRKKRHSAVAKLLIAQLEQPDDPAEKASIISHHWQQAGDNLSAAKWLLLSVPWLLQRNVQSAAACTQNAITLLEQADINLVEHSAARNLAVSAYSGIVRMSALVPLDQAFITHCFNQAQWLAEQANDTHAKAELMMSYSGSLVTSNDADNIIFHIQEAIKLALSIHNQTLITRFRMGILVGYFNAGLYKKGIETLDAASGTDWRTTPIDDNNYSSRAFYGTMLGYMGQLKAGHAILKAALTHSQSKGLTISWMHANIVDLLWLMGDKEQIAEHAEIAYARAIEYDSPFFYGIAIAAQALHLLENKQPAAALELLQASPTFASKNNYASHTHIFVARAYMQLADYSNALKHIDLSIQLSQERHLRGWEAVATLSRYHILLEQQSSTKNILQTARHKAWQAIQEANFHALTGLWHQLNARLAEQNNQPEVQTAELHKSLRLFTQQGAVGRANTLKQQMAIA